MDSGAPRRLVGLLSVVVFADTVLFSAITPLLPAYADRLALSDAEAGMLSAAYPAGCLLGALPASAFAARVGVRPAVVFGMASLAVASVAFGLSESLGALL